MATNDFKSKILIGSGATVVLLALWKASYQYTCWSWFFPFMIFLFIATGQFEHVMLKRKCQVNCMFKQESWVYKVMTGKILLVIFTVFITAVLSIPLITFSALANQSDIIFTVISLTITALLYSPILKFSSHHVIEGMNIIMVKRIVVLFSLTIMLLTYTYTSYYHISVPSYLDETSLTNTVDNASQSVASLCSINNLFLKWSQETEATVIFSMLVASKKIDNSGISSLYWVMFFLNHALVFAALARLQVELISHAVKINNKGGAYQYESTK
ncbi:MAG: hypothetical protein HOM14_13065 [Gammaproteobacteria bacterium]|nr:hypothetical protein [Gammaproteobacteria bacterium]MBT6046827.1 hypothetical protein [Candidatus Scalindua sp.]MBT4193807.1 hypothetical protein [Gammaproteobacteria bacterium]MBT4449346.1 hypothetical protein [Gammaproteobacteria bacterium]MBT4862314.1 hypothetical protein [Gammaproteobacteria bacterium]